MLPVVHHPAYVAKDVPPGHRFPMQKFGLLADILVRDGVVSSGGFYEPIFAPESWLSLAHDPDYVHAVLTSTVDPKRARRIGFPMVESVSNRSRAATAGTVLTARLALEYGLACNTAGGSHHADWAGGAGFCVFNDVAVAAQVLLHEGSVSRVLVFDLDVHQGDGTATIFAGNDRVFTCSVHCEDNWPLRTPKSDLDVGLAAGTGDDAYLSIVRDTLNAAVNAARPDLVFYNAGVDPHREDRLGKLCLTTNGLFERDRMVLSTLHARGIPVAGVLGGGYDKDPMVVAERHSILHRMAAEILTGKPVPSGRFLAASP